MDYNKIWYILYFIIIFLILMAILFSGITKAGIEPYVETAQNFNEVYANNRGIETMTDKQARDRVHWLKFYSTKFRTKIHPDRLWKDAFFIVMNETGFVNYESLDYGLSLGWISMRKSTIDMLNRLFGFYEVPYYKIINSDKLQAKYIISYLAWLNLKGNRHLSIIRYNKGHAYSSFTGTEHYYKDVVQFIKKHEGG